MFCDFRSNKKNNEVMVDWILWFIVTGLIQLIMMNLLIAVMAMTYKKVQDKLRLTMAHGENDIILSLEYYMMAIVDEREMGTQEKMEHLVYAE
jgi:hypothetical protein